MADVSAIILTKDDKLRIGQCLERLMDLTPHGMRQHGKKTREGLLVTVS